MINKKRNIVKENLKILLLVARGELQRRDFNLQDHDGFNHEKDFSMFLETVESLQFLRRFTL